MPDSTAVRDIPAEEPAAFAREARLRYVSDSRPGIARRRSGRGFTYRNPDGATIRDADQLARFKSLAVPPAWSDVWISPFANGHIQATGRDARGRKQFRYHARWREVRDEAKYGRTIAFAKALPRMRRRMDRDLARRGLPREKVLATVVRLLETSFIRVGNAEYARDNKSYGLTTLRRKHVEVKGSKITFRFKGKSGKEHDVGVRDRRLARIVRDCADLPGQELFGYVTSEGVEDVTSTDVNDYLREISGQDFTAKDFRTWAGTVLAAQALRTIDEGSSDAPKEPRKRVVQAVEEVARNLGNTPTVCRQCYVHPAIIDSYLEGASAEVARQLAEQELGTDTNGRRAKAAGASVNDAPKALGAADTDRWSATEKQVLRLLKDRLQENSRRRPRRSAAATS